MAKSKTAKTDDYRSLDEQGLTNLIADEESRLHRMRFSHAVNPMENPLAIRSARRRIAQLKTEQRSRQLAQTA